MHIKHGGSSDISNTNDAEQGVYQNAIRFVLAADDAGVAETIQQLNGYSNSLLLYQIRAGVLSLRASRQPVAVNWEQAWLV